MTHPIAVIYDADGNELSDGRRNWAGFYLTEILSHAGLPFDEIARPLKRSELNDRQVIVLPWSMNLTDDERESIASVVESGAALIALGGTSGLDGFVGAEEKWELQETYLTALHNGHPVTRGLRSNLHCWEGRRLRSTTGGVIARGVGAGDTIVEAEPGKGWSLTIGPDLLYSILLIQQGHPVRPAIGPTRIDAIQGMALDLDRDRVPVPGEEETLAFLEPIADELRTMILRAILWGLSRTGTTVPLLWYWPDGKPAIAHMSHDSDGGDPEKAWSLLEMTKEVDIRTTWCTMMGHYDRSFFDAVVAHGSEVALHYDAQTFQVTADERKPEAEHLKWGLEEMKLQLEAVFNASGKPLTTNKNHTLRWQDRLTFFAWCDELGIEVEQSRGPNTPYTNGFPFGTCHPYFPMDDDRADGDDFQVMELPLMVQDLNRRCSMNLAQLFADRVLDHYGVAHYLFHPGNTDGDPVRAGLRGIVGYLKDRGIPWWTAAEVNTWERARRRTTWTPGEAGWSLKAESPLPGATILVGPTEEGEVERYGFRFREQVVDLAAGETVEVR